MAKGSSLNKKKTIKERTLEHYKDERTCKQKYGQIGISFPIEFSRLYLRVKAKIVNITNVVLNV